MIDTLTASLTQTYRGELLATVDGLPGSGADLTPQQLRALATALLHIAADAEQRKLMHRGRPLPSVRKTYATGEQGPTTIHNGKELR